MDIEELGRTTIMGSRSYALKSKHVDQVFQIDVARPTKEVAEGETLPVVYVLDGNNSFGLTVPTARLLQEDGLSPMLIVGIGYRFEEGRSLSAQIFETRTRDYTPSADQTWIDINKEMFAKRGTDVSRVSTGGAAAFLAFIEEELKPFVASRYAVNEDDQTLMGISLGGLFTLFAMFERPSTFARYGAFSPSIWWNDREIAEKEKAMTVTDLPVRLFLSVGMLEEDAGAPYNMVSNVEKLRQKLLARKYPGLKLSHTEFSDETHASVFPASFSRGLRVLFACDHGQAR